MPIPYQARSVLQQRLDLHRQQRWPRLTDLGIRYRGAFAYVTGSTRDDPSLRLFRLRYLGSPNAWEFAIYLASKDGYADSILPSGSFTGTPEQALDCACGLYLNDPTAWTEARDQHRPDSRKNF